MIRHTLYILFLILFTINPQRLFADTVYKNEDIMFTVKSAVMVNSAGLEQNVLGVRYVFQNLNETRKIDATNPFVFSLMDEFGNKYRILGQPQDFSPAKNLPKNFPSVYPQEKIEETVFFEPPVEKSHFLTFTIDARNIGVNKSIAVTIPCDEIVGIRENINDSAQSQIAVASPEKLKPSYAPIRIVRPASGATVAPGERITVEIKIQDNDLEPTSLMLIIPSYVLEDKEFHNTYDLIVPKDQRGDFSLVVIARWGEGENQELTSDSILLNVVKPSLL